MDPGISIDELESSTDELESSTSTVQMWAVQAESFLVEAPELAHLDSTAEELAAEFDSLPPEEREKV